MIDVFFKITNDFYSNYKMTFILIRVILKFKHKSLDFKNPCELHFNY